MIEVESHRTIDMARYDWARDLLLTFAAIGRHALSEAEAAIERTPGAPEAGLNLLLLLCAAEQVAADHLARGGLDMSAARRALRRAPAAVSGLAVVERTSEAICSVRGSVRDRDLYQRLGSIRALALRLAESTARGEAAADIDPAEIAAVFAGPGGEIATSHMKIPSCFRAQDITPVDCHELASRYVARCGSDRPVLVVGVRTSGSYMAPLVAGWLRARGIAANYTTLRPKSPFVWLEREGVKRFRDRAALIVDDPPMTGASYLRTARRLEECGFASKAITLLVPVGAESALAPEEGRHLSGYRRIELPHADLAIRRDLTSPDLLSFLAHAAGRPNANVTPVWPVEEVERRAGRRHVKQVYAVEGACRVHVKGVGVGWLGYPARHAAAALHDLVPEPLGFWGTLMATREEPVGPTPISTSDMAAYVARRTRALPISAPLKPARFEKDVYYRLAKVLGRVHGPLAPLALGRIRRDLTATALAGPAALIDGRMGPDEWVGGSPSRKRDFEEHAFDKDDLGLYDPIYDIAGAVLEHGPRRQLEADLMRQYVALSGDDGAWDRLTRALLLYGAYLLERRGWEVEGQRGTKQWGCAVQSWLEAEAAMSWAVDRLLADAFPRRRRGPAASVWSIDVDGVLEDAGLGFPSTTPAGALALQVASDASAAVVLNSGRSLPELVLRCDALQLDGVVAEYGSVVWDAATGVSESLLDDDERAALQAVRDEAALLPDVHLDARYCHSVRLRRFVGGRSRALDASQVARLLDAGGDHVQPVHGVRQTDFIGARRDKAAGLNRLRLRSGWRGELFAIGDSEADLSMARAATRAYAPRHRDDALDRVAVHLRSDRQRALLAAVRREHKPRDASNPRRMPTADRDLVQILALRDAPRAWRALRAFGPGLLQVFRT